MKLSQDQFAYLLRAMIEAAEAVQEDHEYRHSDYGGMKTYRFTNDLEKKCAEFNNLDDPQ